MSNEKRAKDHTEHNIVEYLRPPQYVRLEALDKTKDTLRTIFALGDHLSRMVTATDEEQSHDLANSFTMEAVARAVSLLADGESERLDGLEPHTLDSGR